MRRPRRHHLRPPAPGLRSRRPGCRALLIVDNAPLQATAWSELRAARKRLEKTTRDLHRHEQIDEPGFRSWLGTTFPELVTAVRELTQQIAAKSRLVQAVEDESWVSGRSPRSIWRAWQRDAAAPPDEKPPSSDPREDRRTAADERIPLADEAEPGEEPQSRRDFDAEFDEFCAAQGLDPDDPVAQAMRHMAASMSGIDLRRGASDSAAKQARDIYRRLVQHLHPDRGGEWTPQRARLWHEVQAAWETRDADLLARLEAEWEIAADTLGPTSAVSRLRGALAEIHAARRDAERKIRRYRQMPEWRFSVAPPNARGRDELRRALERQCHILRGDLRHLETIIARWERSPQRRRRRGHTTADVGQPSWAFDDSGA